MARPRKFDAAVVKTALRDVFWQHGYDGTSYADIMAATGLNKGSLYASFGDKRALYQHAISNYTNTQVVPAVTMLGDETLSPKDRIMGLFNSLVQMQKAKQSSLGPPILAGRSWSKQDIQNSSCARMEPRLHPSLNDALPPSFTR